MIRRRLLFWPAMMAVQLCLGCDRDVHLTADMPLHLADHLDAATIVGSELPAERLPIVEWHFDEPQPDWSNVEYPRGTVQPTRTVRIDDALRLELTEANRVDGRRILGLVSADVPNYRFGDWGTVLVRARSSDVVGTLHTGFNLYEQAEVETTGLAATAWSASGAARVIGDGSVRTYAFRIDLLDTGAEGPRDVLSRNMSEPMRQIVLRIFAESPSSIDILSVTLAPRAAAYPSSVGVQTETFDGLTHHRSIYMHAPGRIQFPVKVPDAGRLDVGLAAAGQGGAVLFRVTARLGSSDPEVLLQDSIEDEDGLAQRFVDLSHLARQAVTLSLEADTERAGAVAVWSKPTLSGARATERPNVILYVIDGGSADHMSVYGYNRRTTPNLERLAADGVVFENAYSNATHTEVSTPSFVTSLHTSVILGDTEGDAEVPEQPVSMAARLHAEGYQTALLTDNPNAGRTSGVEQGADLFADALPLDVPGITSAAQLHEHYWRWRAEYPGEPYVIHFQTTDVHRPWASVPPFVGLFLPAELRRRAMDREDALLPAIYPGGDRTAAPYEALGIQMSEHLIDLAALYDESLAEQDFMIGQLVKRLEAEGEWGNTLLVIASDHGHDAGGLRVAWNPHDPMLRTGVTRIPLLFVWPGRIPGGQRFAQPVSMIDVMPTVLDLVGLPPPEIAQGQSLAPLMLGEDGWEPRPVILDEFLIDPETGEPTGVIEVIDGRWGASLWVNPSRSTYIRSDRSEPLLLYDLWSDPRTEHSLHRERPDLVQHYTAFLEEQLEAHLSLAQYFNSPSGPSLVTPQQLERLRTLGYIR